MTEFQRKKYEEASKEAGRIAREDRKQEWTDLKEKIIDVFSEDLKKTWIKDLEALETHEERIKYVLERRNIMYQAFYPEDYKKMKEATNNAG